MLTKSRYIHKYISCHQPSFTSGNYLGQRNRVHYLKQIHGHKCHHYCYLELSSLPCFFLYFAIILSLVLTLSQTCRTMTPTLCSLMLFCCLFLFLFISPPQLYPSYFFCRYTTFLCMQTYYLQIYSFSFCPSSRQRYFIVFFFSVGEKIN